MELLRDFVREFEAKKRNNFELEGWSEGAERALIQMGIQFSTVKFKQQSLESYLEGFCQSAVSDMFHEYHSDVGMKGFVRLAEKCLDLLISLVGEAKVHGIDLTEVAAKNMLETALLRRKLPTLERVFDFQGREFATMQ